MTTAAAARSINCTSCGAGLSVLGGGRVQSHVCGYCGAVLDTQDNYKVLDSIGKRDHPGSPVTIGMTLTVEGVEFTVIGTLGMVETYRGRTWKWVEHQIFSPTHGYLWLTFENGNLTLTRKVRDFDMGHWLASATVESSETPPHRSYRDQRYKYYETTTARIDFMEGEFNWLPALGEETTTVSMLGPDAMLEMVDSPREREVEITRLLPRAETARDLGIDERALGTADPSPLAPYKALRDERFIRMALGLTAVVALVLGLLFWMDSGREVFASPNTTLSQMPVTYGFTIDNTTQLAQVRFDTGFSNQWAQLAAEIRGPDGEILIAGDRTVSYYFGREGGENWTEGSRNGSFNFRPVTAGEHTATLDVIEALDGAPGELVLRIYQGNPTPLWLFVLAVVAGLGWLGLGARSAAHRARRFAGSDWSED